MRCPKPCWTPMARDGERHVCPACRTVIVLHDPAYIPAPGYTPSPLRVPAPSPFKELPAEPIEELREEEKGWPQAGPSVFDAPAKRPHPARLPVTDPRYIAWKAKVHAIATDPDVKAARTAALHRRHARRIAKQEAVKARYRERTAGTFYGRRAS